MRNSVDKNYCMSHFLAFRFINDENINFFDNNKKRKLKKLIPKGLMVKCRDIKDVDNFIKSQINDFYIPNKTGLFLSGGIDSAILASYLPEGTPVFTFKCIADGAIDETGQARKYAGKYKLKHIIVEITWDDYLEHTPRICAFHNTPVHSIEIQLYKASLLARGMGIENIIYGDSADMVFGGLHKLLSRDWGYEEFIKRYTFVDPETVLKSYVDTTPVFEPYKLPDGKIDFQRFISEFFSTESCTSYMHSFTMAGVNYLDPYERIELGAPLDLGRIRAGEPKYMLRELFAEKYPGWEIPDKIPMPRPMDQWLANWQGPGRPEFKENCAGNLSGDQKWLVWCLEQFLNQNG